MGAVYPHYKGTAKKCFSFKVTAQDDFQWNTRYHTNRLGQANKKPKIILKAWTGYVGLDNEWVAGF